MEIISLLVKTRRGEVVNQTQLIDIDDIAAPLTPAAAGLDTGFSLREGKKGPFPNQNTNTYITDYVVDQTLAQIAVLAGSIFTGTVLTYKGRALTGTPVWGFNAKFIAGRVVPDSVGGGSKFLYQEDSDPDLVEYTVSETPAQILAQITNNTVLDAWLINGNTEGVERYIGTNDNFAFPIRVNGVERFRFLANGTIQYPLGAANGYVLTSDGTGIATWQAPGGGSSVNSLDPVISELTTPPGAPVLGDRYLITAVATGAWAGLETQVAEWDGATWQYTIPVLDDYIYITNTLTTKRFNGAAWLTSPGIAILQNGNTLGTDMRIGTNDVRAVRVLTSGAVRIYVSATGDTSFGTLSGGGKVVIRGAGITSATFALITEQAGGLPILVVRNDRSVYNTGPGGVISNTSFGENAIAANTTGSGKTAFGYNAGAADTVGADSTYLGAYAGANSAGNLKCVFIGYEAGRYSTGNGGIAIGYNALRNASGVQNVAIGQWCLNATTTGLNNVGVGFDNQNNSTTGSYNVSVGTDGLYMNTDGDFNVSIGAESGYHVQTASHYNTFVGYAAAKGLGGIADTPLNGVQYNTYVGYRAGFGLTSLTIANTIVGADSGINLTGNYNCLVGYNSGNALTTAIGNVFAGVNAGASETGGNYNIGIGYDCMLLATGNIDNTVVGRTAGRVLTNTNGNVLLGFGAGVVQASGNYNVIAGYNAGLALTGGSDNTFLGRGAGGGNVTGSNGVFVGSLSGLYETGTAVLMIDSIQRANLADGRAKSLIYGKFDALVANQMLTVNAEQIYFPYLPTGPGALTTGRLYIDTAANIAANGDKVVAWKV
jgi:hypothetical protein